MNSFIDLFDGFNELVQLAFGFALGLAFSQSNISVGWIFFFIVAWELGVYLLFGKSPYYDPFFRIAYNCVFLLSILVGQYIHYGKTTFEEFLYPKSVTGKKVYSGNKYPMVVRVENFMDDFVEKEEKKIRKKKLRKRYKYFRF
jgi:hypothetical protein